MSVPMEVGSDASTAAPEAVLAGGVGKVEGRSLGQIAWVRLRRDKVALGRRDRGDPAPGRALRAADRAGCWGTRR